MAKSLTVIIVCVGLIVTLQAAKLQKKSNIMPFVWIFVCTFAVREDKDYEDYRSGKLAREQ